MKMSKLVRDKFEQIIKPLVTGKDILDFGSSGQLLNEISTKNKLHLYSEMKKVAKSIMGVDLRKPKLSEQVKKELVYGNAETINLHKKFDVIVCCDMIEHVMNQGLLFKTFKVHTLWHDRSTLTYLLTKNGFKIEEFYYYYGNKIYPWYLNFIFS